MRVRIKICGVTTVEATRAAVEAGVDAIGFVFSESPRQVDVAHAIELARAIPARIRRVAVFRQPELALVEDVVDGFRPQVVQSEPVAGLDRTLPAGVEWLPVIHDDPLILERELPRTHALLFEAAGRGGRGIAPDHGRATELARRRRLILAGGLAPENVAAAIRAVRPYGVDVSSGVESQPGVKDPEKIRCFVAEVRRA